MFRLYKTPQLLWKLMTGYTWLKEGPDKTLYLTFDDGPIPEVTPCVLEQLATYGAKATFFAVGENLVKHRDVAEQVLAQGHRLANHTQHHLRGWETSLPRYLSDVQLCQQELEKLDPSTAHHKLFRPPYGRITSRQATALRPDYELVMWDVLTNDYDNSLLPEKCLRESIRCTQSGSIIVFHDSLKAQRNMRYALPRFLEHFTAQGYTFQTL
ncbi:polysaccharide deacetylase family protein [Pontibacter sp. JH31]|uniref:Polysaccharide deacetylase family protein n=1 Tax=Pontibacter aquaedesilientis TaxID=2766980 RepID=A0ABR7XC40_9BACT|nr:polysaccharide deacetylase family protein [Pontibacter aquaedesilientis]MBD1395854.1 polysaccharide deacetylase family protein [Pontibacter aquaedesilientis]